MSVGIQYLSITIIYIVFETSLLLQVSRDKGGSEGDVHMVKRGLIAT